MLTCRELTEKLTDYLEGRMRFGERTSLFLHLAACRHCRAYVAQMRATIAATGALPDEPIPDEVRVRLSAAFRDRKAKPDTRTE